MVPFQTFLALLALLVLTSCSQTSPPHTEVEKLSQKEATALNANPTDTTPVVKPEANDPGYSADTSYFSDYPSPGVATFTITGGAAKAMYDLMEVQVERKSNNKHKYGFKNGSEVSCMTDNDDTYCTVTVSNTGTVVEALSPNQVVQGTAKLNLTKGNLANVNVVGVDDTKTKSKWARIWIIPEAEFYNSFTAHEESVAPVGEGVTSQFEKVGQDVYCNKQLPVNYFSCYIYMDVTNGSVARISDARPVFDAK